METTDTPVDFADDEPFDDPFAWFDVWYETAMGLAIAYPNAMSLATVSPGGQPRARTVLLKSWDRDGFVIYTNYKSAKGEDLEAEPRASLQVYWRQLDRQFRVEGEVERLDPEASDQYFASRPRGSQIGAWASNQSEPIPSRQALLDQYRAYDEEFDGQPVPRPPHWGGFRLTPTRFEFWCAGEHRLHDRWEFRSGDDRWIRQRLAP